jgi:CRISPR-associated protein Cas5h
LAGAVLGIDRDKIPERFPIDATQSAVCPVFRAESPMQKDLMPENWRQSPLSVRGGRIDKNGLSKFNEGFQVNMEIIRNPCFQIVFWHYNKAVMDELTVRVKDKRWVYQPYLGIMGFLADVEFEAEDEAVPNEAMHLELNSVLPLDEKTEQQVDLSESENYVREERIPLDVLSGRRFRYLTLAYEEPNAKPLIIKAKEKPINYFHLKKKNENIIFFESCAH